MQGTVLVSSQWESKNDFYRFGVKQGLLRGRFSRKQFEVCQERFVGLCDIDQSRMLSIREAVSIGSLGGGQGFITCNRKKCGTDRCKCFKNHLKCNSRCHNSLSCTNKWMKRIIILCQFGSCFLQPRCWGVLSLLVRMFSFYFHLLKCLLIYLVWWKRRELWLLCGTELNV